MDNSSFELRSRALSLRKEDPSIVLVSPQISRRIIRVRRWSDLLDISGGVWESMVVSDLLSVGKAVAYSAAPISDRILAADDTDIPQTRLIDLSSAQEASDDGASRKSGAARQASEQIPGALDGGSWAPPERVSGALPGGAGWAPVQDCRAPGTEGRQSSEKASQELPPIFPNLGQSGQGVGD